MDLSRNIFFAERHDHCDNVTSSQSMYCYLVREDEDVDDVEDGAENTDGDSQVAVNVVVMLQNILQFKIFRKKI